ncbi:hypothetical protein HYY70_05630 [Candidatus Woesearchaeota archaeon]|nr:hypothetical protein [Candidatus Woesearchaeota archaeon]
MDNKTQKERLEQELRFLKESFEAEVISKEEFEKGKVRIEKKLKEIERSGLEQKKQESKIEETAEKIEEKKKFEQMPAQSEEQKKEKTEEPNNNSSTAVKEENAQAAKPDKGEEQEYLESNEKSEENAKERAPQESKIEEKGQKKESRLFAYAVVFVVLVIAVFFSYSYLKSSLLKPQYKENQQFFVAVCASDNDCRQEGKKGICLNPGDIDAKCEFKETLKTDVIVLNDKKDCFNCDTRRVLSILESWFGALNAKEFDYNSEAGNKLAEKFGLRMLPAYIFNESITKNDAYIKFKRSFIQKGDAYILSEDAAGSTYYIARQNAANNLDFFVISGDQASLKAEKNLKEFLDNFKDVKFEKHLSSDKLAQELGVKNFPAFLINNRIKFSGVHAAETIKENFCKLNNLKECGKALSKNLI